MKYICVWKVLQAGQILLQTTPGHIDVKGLEAELRSAFPSIVNVHEFHVWALTPDRTIATAHLIFSRQSVIESPPWSFLHVCHTIVLQ